MARHGRGRRVPFLVALIALGAPASASAQRVEGRVVDQTRAAPIAAAAVTVLSEEGQPLLAVETDSSGFFSLPLTRSGTVRLQASALGYRTTAPTSVTVGPDERLEVEITLAVAALALEPLVITARGRDVSRAHRDFARRRARVRQTGFGRILEGEELETAFRLSTRLVTIGGLRRHRAPDGTLRLGDNRLCPGGVFLNGMYVGNPDLDELVFPSDLEGVEIYRSEAEIPPELSFAGGRPLCTVAALWTKVGETSDGRGFWVRMGILGGLIGSFLLLVAG